MESRARRRFAHYPGLTLAGLITASAAHAQPAWTLADVLARAREQAPGIVVARLAVAGAEGRLAGASLRAQANPEVDVAAGNRQSGDARWTDFQLGLTQPFEPGGRRSARIAGANAAVDRSRASVDATTRDVVVEASMLFYQAVYAGERVRLLTAGAALTQSIVELTERRYRAGDVAILDAHLARAALARAHAERDAGLAEQASVLGALRALLGVDGPFAVQGDLTPSAPLDTSQLTAAVADRPEFRVLEAAIRDADAEVTLAQAYTKPSYGVGVRYQREGPDHIVLGGLTIALPVFSKGQELAATGRARSARLRAELESARVRARIELQTAIDAYERRVSAVRTLATEAVPGIEEVAALTTRSFDVGQIGLKDVLVIRRELLDTRVLALSAQLEVARARVTLEATAGVLR